METVKKKEVGVGFREDEEFVKQLDEAAKKEYIPLQRSTFVRELLHWAFEHHQDAGSLHEMKKRWPLGKRRDNPTPRR